MNWDKINSLTIEDVVPLTPSEMSRKNYMEILYNKVNKKYKGNCSEYNGYIIDVDSIEEILDNEIAIDNSVMYYLKVKLNRILPSVGTEFKGVVTMVFDKGFFVEIYDTLIALVPANFLAKKNFVYANELGMPVFKNRDTGEEISNGVIIKYEIKVTTFKKKRFNCLADLLSVGM